jgi:hypothetical protein
MSPQFAAGRHGAAELDQADGQRIALRMLVIFDELVELQRQ